MHTYEQINSSTDGVNFRVADSHGNRIATCYEEANAVFITESLNALVEMKRAS